MEQLRKDSSVLQELDDMIFDNEQMEDAYNRMSLIYNGTYPSELIASINAASYLNCTDKLNELLILFHFSKDKDLSLLNEDLLFHYNQIVYEDTKIHTFIKYDILHLFLLYTTPLENDFTLACQYGSLKIVKYMFNNCSVDKIEGFFEACKYGKINIVQWMSEFIDISKYKMDAFIKVFQFGHVEIAQFLYNLGEIDVHYHNDDFFISSCQYGFLDLAKWLYSIYDELNHLTKQKSFFFALIEDDLEMMKWIYSLGNINIFMVLYFITDTNRNVSVKTLEWMKSLR